MSSVSERERALILDLLLGKISETEFCRDYATEGIELRLLGLTILRRSLKERDPVGVEFGLYLAHRFGISTDYQDVLVALAHADWHERHEDVIDGLAKLRATASVDALFHAATTEYAYRAYDEHNALASKAIIALGRIENQAAISALGELARRGTPAIQSQARTQLKEIENRALPNVLRLAAHHALRAERD